RMVLPTRYGGHDRRFEPAALALALAGKEHLEELRDPCRGVRRAAPGNERVEVARESSGGRIALLPASLEGSPYHGHEGARNLGLERPRVGDRTRVHGPQRLDVVVTLEEASAGEELPQGRAEAEHVAPAVDRELHHLLGRQVRELTFHDRRR